MLDAAARDQELESLRAQLISDGLSRNGLPEVATKYQNQSETSSTRAKKTREQEKENIISSIGHTVTSWSDAVLEAADLTTIAGSIELDGYAQNNQTDRLRYVRNKASAIFLNSLADGGEILVPTDNPTKHVPLPKGREGKMSLHSVQRLRPELGLMLITGTPIGDVEPGTPQMITAVGKVATYGRFLENSSAPRPAARIG